MPFSSALALLDDGLSKRTRNVGNRMVERLPPEIILVVMGYAGIATFFRLIRWSESFRQLFWTGASEAARSKLLRACRQGDVRELRRGAPLIKLRAASTCFLFS